MSINNVQNLNKKMFNRKLISKQKIIVCDGIAGGGKSLICNLISSLPGVDQWIADPTLEQNTALVKLKKLSLDTGAYLIKTNHNRLVYDTAMFRNSNFRKSDKSAVTNHPRYKKFKDRLGFSDKKIYSKYKNKIFIHYLTHMILNNAEVLFKAFEKNLIYIQLFRSPLALEMILHLKNWVKKWEKIKARDGYIKIYNKRYKKNIPYFLIKNSKDYFKANYLEKVIILLSVIFNKEKNKLQKISKKYNSKILIVPFEKLIVSPIFYLKKISKILNVKIDNVVHKTLVENKVPRSFSLNQNNIQTIKFIKNKVRNKYFKKLIEINNYYEKEILKNF